ncbi:transglutaminase family protein [Oxalobacteraceae bacterium R-40]|uniref:Transglutaminase family protein n=1 Tax=Keguizhuia sedimenti TaxID=3064264 RepID=A0ABU1BNN1_9BURK|nr:transglutaminase family protein [Oxalobacteraceae bacterium R-40]
MLLAIRHETLYRYTEPARYSIQQLRLTPRQENHQRVLSWKILAPGHRHAFTDAYDNLCHTLTLTSPHDEVRISVEGQVEIGVPERGRIVDKGALSPLLFTVPTHLTKADEALTEFAFRELRPSRRTTDFLALAEAIRASVSYVTGSTAVTSTAAEAFAQRQGVCQDHAHLFLACCHVMGIPVRYVSGYIDSGSTRRAESHAWVDVWVEEAESPCWVSIDVTHAQLQGDSLCRLAVGRDYESAAPVRGIRRGGGAESLSVDVSVFSPSLGNQ